MVRLRLLLLPSGLQHTTQHVEGTQYRHHDGQEEWNVDGVLLLVREVQLRQQAGVKESALRGHERTLGQHRSVRQSVLQKSSLGSQDVGIGICNGGTHLVVYHNVADLI